MIDTFFAYIKAPSVRAELAEAVGYSPDYLWQVATNRRRASAELAIAIEQATDCAIPRSILRPDLWGEPSKVAA